MAVVAAINRASETARLFPLGAKLGLAVMVLGIVADLVAHLGPVPSHSHGGVSGPQLSAHLVVFVGMVLVLVGVVLDGVLPRRRAGDLITQREVDPHAVR